jgi:plastocyanin
VIWIRAGLLAVLFGLVVLALTETTATRAPQTSVAAGAPASSSEPPTPFTAPTQAPTRVPLPTLPPQMVISRVSRETPAPLATSTPSAEARVGIVDNAFVPAQMALPSGKIVIWSNGGSEGHDVTGSGPGGAWRSGTLAPLQQYERVFAQPGIYDYACTIHPEMRGRVVVQP